MVLSVFYLGASAPPRELESLTTFFSAFREYVEAGDHEVRNSSELLGDAQDIKRIADSHPDPVFRPMLQAELAKLYVKAIQENGRNPQAVGTFLRFARLTDVEGASLRAEAFAQLKSTDERVQRIAVRYLMDEHAYEEIFATLEEPGIAEGRIHVLDELLDYTDFAAITKEYRFKVLYQELAAKDPSQQVRELAAQAVGEISMMERGEKLMEDIAAGRVKPPSMCPELREQLGRMTRLLKEKE